MKKTLHARQRTAYALAATAGAALAWTHRHRIKNGLHFVADWAEVRWHASRIGNKRSASARTYVVAETCTFAACPWQNAGFSAARSAKEGR
jgi:hypothetical protein